MYSTKGVVYGSSLETCIASDGCELKKSIESRECLSYCCLVTVLALDISWLPPEETCDCLDDLPEFSHIIDRTKKKNLNCRNYSLTTTPSNSKNLVTTFCLWANPFQCFASFRRQVTSCIQYSLREIISIIMSKL